jgi:hypothetical protein
MRDRRLFFICAAMAGIVGFLLWQRTATADQGPSAQVSVNTCDSALALLQGIPCAHTVVAGVDHDAQARAARQRAADALTAATSQRQLRDRLTQDLNDFRQVRMSFETAIHDLSQLTQNTISSGTFQSFLGGRHFSDDEAGTVLQQMRDLSSPMRMPIEHLRDAKARVASSRGVSLPSLPAQQFDQRIVAMLQALNRVLAERDRPENIASSMSSLFQGALDVTDICNIHLLPAALTHEDELNVDVASADGARESWRQAAEIHGNRCVNEVREVLCSCLRGWVIQSDRFAPGKRQAIALLRDRMGQAEQLAGTFPPVEPMFCSTRELKRLDERLDDIIKRLRVKTGGG